MINNIVVERMKQIHFQTFENSTMTYCTTKNNEIVEKSIKKDQNKLYISYHIHINNKEITKYYKEKEQCFNNVNMKT
jgi:hypothetical protein